MRSRARIGCALLAAALSASIAGGCSSPSVVEPLASRQDAIYGGTPDTTHDAIMGLLHIERASAGACTGTTIAKQGASGILLTAAHCTVAIDSNDNVVIPLQVVNPDSLEVIPGTDWIAGFDSSKTFGVGEVTIHPQYDGNVQSPFDVALVRYLGATDATPMIPALSLADDKLMVGSTITLYGYGKTETNANNSQRRKVDKVIENLTTRQILYDQQDGKGSCRGDSGGPALVQTPGGERVAAVTSYGDQDCTQVGVSVRVSSAASFVQGALAALPTMLSCTDCRTASIGPNSQCFAQRVACTGSSPCGRFFACVSPCKDSVCYSACVTRNPAGAQASDALLDCECSTACAKECTTDPSCGAPACGGLSVPGALCTSCIQQGCCHESEMCAANAACSACFHHTGTQCGTNTLYNGFLGCLSRCNGNPCKLTLPPGGSADAGSTADGGTAGDAGAVLAIDADVPVHYQVETPAVAASQGGCSCRQPRGKGRDWGRALGGICLVAIAVARVRNKRRWSVKSPT